ncbi:hypothetical protein ZEAMMB73_Zm00001d004828, partial [Zea mays]
MKIFSSVGATSHEKNFVDGDIDGLIQWMLSEIHAYKNVIIEVNHSEAKAKDVAIEAEAVAARVAKKAAYDVVLKIYEQIDH